MAYDPDPEDSIHVQYVNPKGINGTNVSFAPGFSAQDPFGIGANAVIDSLTGLITLDTLAQGDYLFAQKIQSFRNGVLVSKVVRDMEQYVLSYTNRLLLLLTTSSISTTGSIRAAITTLLTLNWSLGETFSCTFTGLG